MPRFTYRDYPNRTLCDVLDEMRNCNKTHNYSYLPGLIEELQVMGNRMEASLYDLQDLEILKEEYEDLKKKVAELKVKRNKLDK